MITAVNGTPTTTECSLINALHGLAPGSAVALSVEESSINNVGEFVSGPVVTKSVTLGTPPKGLVDTGCGPPTKPTAFLGIDPMTQQDWHFPVKVVVHTQDIGGPSAGLPMTLGIIDKLSSGRLTGNRIVAATGTIDQNGNVGDVGGVAEKTIAVERAGATVFFVPSLELHDGRVQGHPATPRLRREQPEPGAAHPQTARGQRADPTRGAQSCAGPGFAVGSGPWQKAAPPSRRPGSRPGTSPSTPSPIVRRGFDTDEVRSYLQSVSRSLEALEAREEELRAALAEAEQRAAHPVVDEATLTASLGQHSAQILRHAHEEAARIVVQAQEGAATLLRDTQSQVERAAGAHRGVVRRAGRRGGAAGGERRAGGPRRE